MTTRPLVLLLLLGSSAYADHPPGVCIDVGAHFVPSSQLQIVAWVEDSHGNFVETIY